MARGPKNAYQSPGQYDPIQGQLSRTKTTPIPVPQTTRTLELRGLTSVPVGKCVPLAAFALLRGDRVRRTRIRVNAEMLETVELLMNAVNFRVMAYLVPNLAFDRFNGIDQLNRSYAKIQESDGNATVIPFFESIAFDSATNQVLTYMGKHARPGQMVNTAYNEAYNEIYNFRVANRSPDIAKRAKVQRDLAKAFWMHTRFSHIVPDFDQAVLDGEVALNVVNAKQPVMGIGFTGTPQTPNAGGAALPWRQSGSGSNSNTNPSPPGFSVTSGTLAAGNANLYIQQRLLPGQTNLAYPDVFTEMQENGITVSLSNIDMARKTQAFARLRKQYTGHSDDYIIDMLMNGLAVPEQAWRQPILLADQSTIFGLNKRYATTADDLTASVTNGGTYVDLGIGTPVVPTGGIVMLIAEVTPEQLFERQMDPYLVNTDPATLPEFMNDTLDPEKVEVVENQYIDMDHDVPTGTFGYAPLNYKWGSIGPMIGGKFYRPAVDAAFDEDRQRIWAVETQNPTLSEDFYLCTNMHQKPFVVTDQDNFEAVTRGMVPITGNTVFGQILIEASDDYDTIMGGIDQDRIDKPATTAVVEDESADSFGRVEIEDTPDLDPADDL